MTAKSQFEHAIYVNEFFLTYIAAPVLSNWKVMFILQLLKRNFWYHHYLIFPLQIGKLYYFHVILQEGKTLAAFSGQPKGYITTLIQASNRQKY